MSYSVLEKYIKKELSEGKTWEVIAEQLKQKPYCIDTNFLEEFALLKYNQIESDFYNPLVKEARGIIFRKSTGNIVCHAFNKFGNYGEGYSDKIDWSSATVSEKVDGSIIKLWNAGGDLWRISTNGTINAYTCPLPLESGNIKTFGDLWDSITEGIDCTKLKTERTYIFEITSLLNKVVVTHLENSIWYLGERDTETGKEYFEEDTIKKFNCKTPKVFHLNSLEDCIETAKILPFNEEGYVVKDKDYNRIKIKSPAYVSAHHLKNNGVVTKSRVLDLIDLGEKEEFLNYYPEYSEHFIEIENKKMSFIDSLEEDKKKFEEFISTKDDLTRKEIALFIQKNTNKLSFSFLFELLDDKTFTIAKFYSSMSKTRKDSVLNL